MAPGPQLLLTYSAKSLRIGRKRKPTIGDKEGAAPTEYRQEGRESGGHTHGGAMD